MKRYFIKSIIITTVIFSIIVFRVNSNTEELSWQNWITYGIGWLAAIIINAYLDKWLTIGAENAKKEREERWNQLDN